MTEPAQVTMPPLVTLPAVELMATGTWHLATGEATFTTADLADAVDAAQCPSVGDPIIKLGHTDGRFLPTAADGEPAIGRVLNLTLSQDGNKLSGDLSGMPGWLAAVSGSAYPQRSIEGAWDWVCQIGHLHPFVVTAVALLGVAPPGVGVIKDLDDVAALYGVQAGEAPQPVDVRGRWEIAAAAGGAMPGRTSAGAVTVDDVRRTYYGSGVPMSMWITAIQMDPPQLIVADDASDKVFRVPYTIKAGEVTFGDPVEVEVEYVDVKAAGQLLASGALFVYASQEDSREGLTVMAWSASTQLKNMGDSPSKAAISKMFALPGSTKSDSKLPHHTCASGGTVGGPDLAGCQAAIGAINGGRGGLSGVSAADAKKAYNHLAGHVRDLGAEPAEYSGPSASAAGDDPQAGTGDDPAQAAAGDPPEAGGPHGPFTGTHTHPHSANGDQGGDAEHDHAHAHKGDAKHAHAHLAGSGPNQRGVPDVDFTDEMLAQARTLLGLDEDAEITAEQLMAALEAKAGAPATASALPPGVVAVDKDVWEQMNARIAQGERAREVQLTSEMETAISGAVQAGKFPVSRADHWRRVWRADPEGTRMVLAGLTPGVVPTRDIGAPGPDEPGIEDEYKALFPPSYPRTPA
jgi:hypothetical protein